jgi:SNF2 family DNA or RNA helicase
MAKLISKRYVSNDSNYVYDIEVADNHNYFAENVLVHNCSPSSKQGTQMLKLKKDTMGAKVEWLPMTGTPIVNKPTDVFVPLKLVDGHTFNRYYDWCQNFCVYGGFGNHDIITYKNIPQLKQMLQGNMLRRLKSEVLDLPPKIHTIEYVENTPYQSNLYDIILADTVAHRSEILSALNPMTKLLRLRQVNGSPELVDLDLNVDKSYPAKNSKLVRLLDLVDSIVSSGEKVVIFSNWVESLRTVYKFLALKYKVCCYTGTMQPDEREKHKQMFINNPNCQIIIGTVGALGVSHTFTVANNVIFYDLPWNPATMEQAEDRCHRAGTTSTVNIYSIITKDTVDEKVYKLIQNKDGIAKYIVDNELSFRNNPELFDLLFGKDK